jgi:ADP-ribosylglycohydrolase
LIESAQLYDRVAGLILGTAVGDALGLPREGLSAGRASRWYGELPLKHALVFGRGMCSDDTEHTCMVAQAWLAANGDPNRFVHSFAWRLRFWLLGLPAGIGGATLKSIVKLWVGFPTTKSGVWSAGNGPAMRAAIIGVLASEENDALFNKLVSSISCITHSDPRAEEGARVVAVAARIAVKGLATIGPIETIDRVRSSVEANEISALLDNVRRALVDQTSPAGFANMIGCDKGVSGFVNHTVPVALFCWLRNPTDFRAALESVIRLGGDTDSTAAITGALAGVTLGANGIPDEWVDGICEWPRSTNWMRGLARCVTTAVVNRKLQKSGTDGDHQANTTQSLFWPGLLPRNIIFLLIVLAHGFRRLAPPY